MIQNSQYYQTKSIQIKPIVHLYSNLVTNQLNLNSSTPS